MKKIIIAAMVGLFVFFLLGGVVMHFKSPLAPQLGPSLVESVDYPPLRIKEIEEDFENPLTDPDNTISLKEAQGFTVPIKDWADDVSKIRSTGVFIETQEPDYIVILGDQKRIDAVRSLGFTLREIKESDHKLRPIKVWVDTQEQYERVHRAAADIWPKEEIPGYAYGRAYDFQIEKLRKSGYKAELCSGSSCNSRPDTSGVTF